LAFCAASATIASCLEGCDALALAFHFARGARAFSSRAHLIHTAGSDASAVTLDLTRGARTFPSRSTHLIHTAGCDACAAALDLTGVARASSLGARLIRSAGDVTRATMLWIRRHVDALIGAFVLPWATNATSVFTYLVHAASSAARAAVAGSCNGLPASAVTFRLA
jgi:hypothetical protein